MHNTLYKGMFYSFLVMIFWALHDVMARYFAVHYQVSAFIFICFMFFVGSVVLVGFAGPGHKGISTLRRGHTWFYGLINIGMNLAEIYALFYITSTEMNFLNRMTVLMSLMATWVFFNRRPYKSDIFGAVLVFAGLYYIITGLPQDVRLIAFVTVFISAALSTASAMVGEVHQDNVEAKGIKEQARVTGYVLLACSFIFLLASFILGALKGAMPPEVIETNILFASVPDLSAFLHKPTFYGGLIMGVTVVPLSMYYFFVATKTAKTETFMVVSSTLPFLTFFFEWCASELGLLDIRDISVGDMVAGLAVVAGAFLMQYLRYKADKKGSREDRRKSNRSDDYDMVASALSFCDGDMLLCAEKLGIPAETIEEVYARKGEVGLEVSGSEYKQILRNYHRHIATVDNLTGLSNKDTLTRAIEGALEKNEKFCVVFMDLNKFKPVNDTHGHEAGDKVLKVVAERLKESLGNQHVVSRIGGDEFVVMLRDATRDAAEDIMMDVMAELVVPISLENGKEVSVGSSFGIAVAFEDGKTAEDLIKAADKLMYRDKESR